MSDIEKKCQSICCFCMFDTKDPSISSCPKCNKPVNCDNGVPSLKPRTLLSNKRYLLGRCLGKGGFGITYLGLDLDLDMPVAIKEYFPRELAERQSDQVKVCPKSPKEEKYYKHGLESFLEEARTIAKFQHPSIVAILFSFEENGTAYFVMRYIPGMTLEDLMQERQGKITEGEMLSIFCPLLDGLQEVHKKKVLHRDIKPANIFLSNNGTPVLLDFGSARQTLREDSQGLSVFLTQGWAPLEQYPASEGGGKKSRAKQGPWTDIYGCAATMYGCLRGEMKNGKVVPPPYVPDRVDGKPIQPLQNVANGQISSSLSTIIMKGLELYPKNRPQSVEELLVFLRPPETPPPAKNLGMLVLAGEFEGQKLSLSTKTITIGRDSSKSSLIFSSNIISSTHCQIHAVNGIAYVKDLSSTNGTWVNDTRRVSPLETIPIQPGETISLAGSVVLQIIEDDDSKEKPSSDITVLKQGESSGDPGSKTIETPIPNTRGGGVFLKYLFFSHQGRISRKPYVVSNIFLAILLITSEFVFGEGASVVVSLATLYSSLMLGTKRAHDRNKSGHFCWLFFVPIVNFFPALELAFFKGTEGPNRFGDDPLQKANSQLEEL